MRTIKLILTVVLAALAVPAALQAAAPRGPEGRGAAGQAATVNAILIVASKQPGRTDPRLAAYEGILRDNLRFESFRYVGEGSATVPAGGRGSISLPQG